MTESGLMSISGEQAMAFRLESHGLAKRLPAGSLLKAFRAGMQNSPPGSAGLSLYARVRGLTPDDVERALGPDKTVIQSFGMRTAPYVYPVEDAAIYTLGLKPDDEESIRSFIPGVVPALDLIGVSAVKVVKLTEDALLEMLDGRMMTKDELGVSIADKLSPAFGEPWRSDSWCAASQTVGESVVRFALYVVALNGTFCYGPRRVNKAYFVRTDQWLGRNPPGADADTARAELVRRYLRCYAPSTPKAFSGWAGISQEQASRSWDLIAGEAAEVRFMEKPAWALHEDMRRLSSSKMPDGVRLLPPHDPLLQVRDRRTLVPDRKLHGLIWKIAGNPGALIVDGRFGGIWRTKKKGKMLKITVETSIDMTPGIIAMIKEEAAGVAMFKGCKDVEVEYKSL